MRTAREQLASHIRRGPQPTPELVSRADQARLPNVPFSQLAEVLGENEHQRVRLALEERVVSLVELIRTVEIALGRRPPPAGPAPVPDPAWVARR